MSQVRDDEDVYREEACAMVPSSSCIPEVITGLSSIARNSRVAAEKQANIGGARH